MSADARGTVAVVGVGHTPQGELPGRSAAVNSVFAVREALRDAGADKSQIDGLITCKSVQGANTDTEVGPLLGFSPGYSQTLDYGTCNFSLHLAVQAIRTGFASVIVLCYGSNARTAGVRFARPSRTLAALSGLVHIAGPAALALQRYKATYGITDEQFGMIAVAQREWAQRNENAIFREPLTIEQYLDMPYLVEPLRRADLTMISDGGVALILTSAERAGEFAGHPVYIRGMSERTAIQGEYHPDYLNRDFLAHISADLWSSGPFGPADIDVLYIQDPTALWVLQMIESYGFAPVGEAGAWLAEGHTRPGGDLPLNTNGGQLSESYMWGWLHVVEAVRQLRGEAGERQVKDAQVALYCSTQAWVKGGASILSAHADGD